MINEGLREFKFRNQLCREKYETLVTEDFSIMERWTIHSRNLLNSRQDDIQRADEEGVQSATLKLKNYNSIPAMHSGRKMIKFQ